MGHGHRTARRRQQAQTPRTQQQPAIAEAQTGPALGGVDDAAAGTPVLDAVAAEAGRGGDPTTEVALDGNDASVATTAGSSRARGQVGLDGHEASGSAQLRRGSDDDHVAISSTLNADGGTTRGLSGQRRSEATPIGGDGSLPALADGERRDPRHDETAVVTPRSERMTRRGRLTGGVSYTVGRPQPLPGGGYSVAWRIDATGGGRGEATGSSSLAADASATGSAGISASGRLSGTEIFEDQDAAMALFRDFTPVGDSLVADQVSRNGLTPDWQQVDIGTERAGRVALTATVAAKGKIGSYFSLGASFQPTAAASVKAKRKEQDSVELESKVEGSVPLGLDISGPGVGVTATETASVELTWKQAVSIVDSGRPAPLERMYWEIFTPPVEGAREISHSIERSVGDELGATIPGVSASSSDTVERVRTVTAGEADGPGEVGQDRVSDRVRGRHEESVEALGGSYARSTTLVDLNAENGRGYAQTRVASDDADSSHDMLSQALTGQRGGDAGRSGDSSGSWVVHRTFTEAQLTRIYAALGTLGEGDDSWERGFERTTLDALDALARATGALPAGDTSAEAQRAELLAGYIAQTGRQGIDLLESVAGLRTERRAMLYTDGHRDPVFTSQRDEAAIEQQISGFEQGESEQVRSDAQQLYDDLSTRLRTLQDAERYPEVPAAYRNELLGRYGGWIVRLEAVLAQAGGTLHFGWGQALSEQLDRVLPQLDDAAFARQDAARRHCAWTEGTGTPDGTPIFEVADPVNSRNRGLMSAVWERAEAGFEVCDRRLRQIREGGGINPSDPERSVANLASDVERMGVLLVEVRRQYETMTSAYELLMDQPGQTHLRDLLPDRAPEPYRADPLVRSGARLAS